MNTRLTCDQIELLLPALVRGELAPARASEVQSHLATCESCREVAESLRLLNSAMELSPGPDRLDESHRAEILLAFENRKQAPGKTHPLLKTVLAWLNPARPPTPGLAVAVTCLLLIGLAMYVFMPASLSLKKSDRAVSLSLQPLVAHEPQTPPESMTIADVPATRVAYRDDDFDNDSKRTAQVIQAPRRAGSLEQAAAGARKDADFAGRAAKEELAKELNGAESTVSALGKLEPAKKPLSDVQLAADAYEAKPAELPVLHDAAYIPLFAAEKSKLSTSKQSDIGAAATAPATARPIPSKPGGKSKEQAAQNLGFADKHINSPVVPPTEMAVNESLLAGNDRLETVEARKGWSERKEQRNGQDGKNEALGRKLDATIIPSLDFRGATMREVVDQLAKDTKSLDPEGKGVAFNLESADSSPAPDDARVTLHLNSVSAADAVRYLTEVSGYQYRLVNGKVQISPEAVVMGSISTRIYPVSPHLFDSVISGADPSNAIKGFLENLGVKFPAGTDATYDRERGQLTVSNLPENLAAFEKTLANLQLTDTVAPNFNPVHDSKERALSTFSIDVDTASYTLTRQALASGRMPDPELVRSEEIINAFDYDYDAPASGAFAIRAEFGPTPFRAPLELLKIGIQGRRLGRDQHRPAVLTLVIDGSGSMDTADRLGRIRRALHLLIPNLKAIDRVAIVQFSDKPRVVLDRVAGDDTNTALAAVDSLSATGSTDLEAGLRLGYEIAARDFVSGGANRVVLFSDGVANLGADNAQSILATVESYRRQGIYLSVLGFGNGNYDDAMLEQLADRGDGQYSFIDSDEEARRVLVDDWEQTLHVIARDVKIQVVFNPERVARWRQIGYENRKLRDEDFRNDAVDAGEVGSGQSVTALYDIELAGDPSAPLATVRVRYEDPDTGAVQELSETVGPSQRHPDFAQAPARFQVAAAAAQFSELLRGSPYAAGAGYDAVSHSLGSAAAALPLDQRIRELAQMALEAAALTR